MIRRIISESSIDFPGKFGPVVFTAGCNFNCGFCHNAGLSLEGKDIDEDKLLKELEDKIKSGWYNGICITGGEPTLHSGLENFIRKLKKLGLAVKLDSNGTNPDVLKKLIDLGLVDYIAMDIKSPKNLYSDVTQVKVNIENIEKSIKLLSSLPLNKLEFRTTIPFIFEEGKPRFMNKKEAEEMAEWVFSLTHNKNIKWFVQGFISRDKEDMNNPELSVQVLPKEMQKTSQKVLDDVCEGIGKFFSDVGIR